MKRTTMYMLGGIAVLTIILILCILRERYNWSTVYQDVCGSQIKPKIERCQKEHGFGQDYLNCSCKIGESCATTNSSHIQELCKRQLASEFKICDRKCLSCDKYTKNGKCKYVCDPRSSLFSSEKCRECTDCNEQYKDECKAFDAYTEKCNEDCNECMADPCMDPIDGPCSYDRRDPSKWTQMKNPNMCKTCKGHCSHDPFNCDVKGDMNYFR